MSKKRKTKKNDEEKELDGDGEQTQNVTANDDVELEVQKDDEPVDNGKIFTFHDVTAYYFLAAVGQLITGILWFDTYGQYSSLASQFGGGAFGGIVPYYFINALLFLIAGACWGAAFIIDWHTRRPYGCCCCTRPSGCLCEYDMDPKKQPKVLVILTIVGTIAHFGILLYNLAYYTRAGVPIPLCWGRIVFLFAVIVNLLYVDCLLILDLAPMIYQDGRREREWLLRGMSLGLAITSGLLAVYHGGSMTFTCFQGPSPVIPEHIVNCVFHLCLMAYWIFIFINYKSPGKTASCNSNEFAWFIKIGPIVVFVCILIVNGFGFIYMSEAMFASLYLAVQWSLCEVWIWKKVSEGNNEPCCCIPCCGQEYVCCCDGDGDPRLEQLNSASKVNSDY